MGFLENLKRQADALKAEATVDVAALERNTALADSACKTALQYLTELAPQLNVLRPRHPSRLSLDNRTPLEGLVRCDFRVDARKKILRDKESVDHVVMHFWQKSGVKVTMRKDFPPEIERLETRLRQAGVMPDRTVVRDPVKGTMKETVFVFTADIVGMVRIQPDHDTGRVTFRITNLDAFEVVTAEFPATKVGSALLDEMARWIAGDNHEFFKDAENLKRVET
jgi:hypothetical protein